MIYRIEKLLKRKWANWYYTREILVSLNQPVITFTFDDAPASAFENGGSILKKYGYTGTYYIALSLLEENTSRPLFTRDHLETARQYEHELGCHTFGHISLNRTSLQDSQNDIEYNAKRYRSLFPGSRLNNFSYPFGEQNSAIKKTISSCFRSARGVEHGINTGPTDRLNLKTVRLYESRSSLDAIRRQIDRAEKNKGWLIFYTHDVEEPYSAGGCSPAYFEAVVKEVALRKLRVLTVDRALDLIEGTLSNS